MPDQIANPDNSESQSADKSNKRWFKHFKEGSEERRRIRLSLTIFSITLILCFLGLAYGHFRQLERYNWRLTNTTRGLPGQLKDIRDLKYIDEPSREKGLHEKAQQIFENFKDRPYNSDSEEERRVLDALVEKYIRPFASPVVGTTQPAATPVAFDEAQLANEIGEYFKPIILKDYAILYYQPILIVWIIFGVVYWLVIFNLYNLGLNPGVGEPTFNIIDLGFLAVLIQYTGGLNNTFLLAYLFSLMLATFDFFYRKDNPNYQKMRSARRFIIIFGPYVFSFILSVFWATYERVFSREDNWEDYAVLWAILVLIAILCGIGFHGALKFYSSKNPIQPSQPPAASGSSG